MSTPRLPPPPMPPQLREMLKDYPEHMERLQEALDSLIEGPHAVKGPAYANYEVAIWALESRLDAFYREAKEEHEAARASGDEEAIVKANAKERLMGRAGDINGGMADLHGLHEYLKQHEEALK